MGDVPRAAVMLRENGTTQLAKSSTFGETAVNAAGELSRHAGPLQHGRQSLRATVRAA